VVNTPDDRQRQRNQAVDLYLGNMPVKQIAKNLDLTEAVVKRLVKEGLKERAGADGLAENVMVEIARIDGMISGLWAQARRGEVDKVDRVAKLQERRAKLVTPRENKHQMREAFDRTVELSKDVKAVDAGAVQLGREYADRIDEAIATAEGQELTKALYLGPHILGVFRELLATPAARAAADRGEENEVSGQLKNLRSIAQKQQRGA